jgi:hypothetical protein
MRAVAIIDRGCSVSIKKIALVGGYLKVYADTSPLVALVMHYSDQS